MHSLLSTGVLGTESREESLRNVGDPVRPRAATSNASKGSGFGPEVGEAHGTDEVG